MMVVGGDQVTALAENRLLSHLAVTRQLAVTARGDSRAVEVSRYAVLIAEDSDAMIALGNRFYALDAFHILFMKPGTRFFFRYGTHCNYYLVYLGPDTALQEAGEVSRLVQEVFHQRFFLIKPPDEARGRLLLRVLAYTYEKLQSLHGMRREDRQYLGNAAAFLMSLLHEFQALYDLQLGSPEDLPLPEQIVQFIDRHYASPLSLDSLESEFYLSKHHLCRAFKKHYGIGIMQYLNITRLRYARRMLENSHEGIQAIAEACGFPSYQSFYRQFVRRFRRPPARYRDGMEA